MKIAKCTICKKKLFSDATAKKYCKLCGMISGNEDYCCINCKSKLKEILK